MNRPNGPVGIIQGAAGRLAENMAVIRNGQDEHGIESGPHDDLTTRAFASALLEIYQQTLSPSYIERLALTSGAIADLMELVGSKLADIGAHDRWGLVKAHFKAIAEVVAPDYQSRTDELPSLSLAVAPTPAVARFDLVAAAASRAGVLRLADAAAWVVEVTESLPELDDEEYASSELVTLAGLPAI